MNISTILFDLDGTLLPMDQDIFAEKYVRELVAATVPFGYDSKIFASAVIKATAAMTENNGRQTNKEVFWDSLSSTCGKDVQKDSFIFDGFYESSFYKVRESCGFAPEAAEVVGKFKQSGFRLALATNPLFPAVATENRIRWAGLEPDDFELFTSYEESHYCKPNLDYYREVLTALNVFPEECMMVGNDVSEDMIAEQLGMKVFLLTDCIINRNNLDISGYPHGSFKELAEYVENLTGKVH